MNRAAKKTRFRCWPLFALFVICSQTVAQESNTVDDSIEPGFDTSAAMSAGPGSRSAEIDTLEPAAATSRPVQSGPVTERRRLDTMSIIGNQELPKVLYIVPWKKSELGDLMGRPINSLLDEVLAPVDRDVFRRYLEYYEELHPDQSQEDE